MTSFFINNEQVRSEMSLVLALLSNGCTFEQIKRITGCKQDSQQTLVLQYFGKSKSIYQYIKKYLSDEQCLKIWLMILNEKAEFNRKFMIKLIYPSFICLFTFLSLIFFKVTLIPRLRSMFESVSNDATFFYFDLVLYTLIIVYLILFVLYLILRIMLNHPNTRNYCYLALHARYKDNLITVYNTGLFSKILLECFKSGVSTQNSFEILGKLSDLPFVMLLSNNCASRLSEGIPFIQSISSIETDSSFKVFMQLGLYANKVIDQLINYCTFNTGLFESKLKRMISFYYAFVYIQFLIAAILLYQVIQIPIIAIGSQI